jgi:uncharacterized protein HemX
MIGEITQAAAEVARQGGGSGQVVTWTAVAMAIVSNVGTWLMILKRGSKQKKEADALTQKNTAPDPAAENSPWPMVRAHDGILVRHEAEIKGIVKGMDESRVENREAHKQIFDAINGLRTGK